MSESNGAKQICVVLDTNIWVHKTSLLRTVLGAALTSSVVRLEGVLGLPEVVEEEIVKHAVKEGAEAAARIRTDLAKIEKLVGYRDRYSPPDKDRFEEGAKERLRELDHLLKRVPHDFRQLRSALARVMNETPPNSSKNQQYKDSVIWEAVKDLSDTHAVSFVTHDTGFFEDKKPDKGLAANLKAECEREGRTISVYHGIDSYLKSIREEVPPLNYPALARAVEHEIVDHLRRLTSDQGWQLHELLRFRISAFLTERPGTLALSFELDHRATVVLPSGDEVETVITTSGECFYNLRDHAISDVRIDRVDFTGAEHWGIGMVYLYGSAGESSKPVPYSLRAELEE